MHYSEAARMGANKLRSVVSWLDSLPETLWYPPPGTETPSLEALVQLYGICQQVGTGDPRDLGQEPAHIARLWFNWQKKHYGRVRYARED